MSNYNDHIDYESLLKKDISSKNFLPVYLLYGDDQYLKKHYRDVLAKKAFGGDPFFNLQVFENDVNLQEVFDAVVQFPIMADRKSVVLSDYDFEHADKEEFERLLSLVSEANDTCVLILHFDGVTIDTKKSDRVKKLFSAIKKVGGVCAEINHRSITSLVKILCDGAKKRGCTMTEISARYLIEISNSDLSTLQNELDKLCVYVGNGEITKDIIDAVSVKSVDASVYDYVKQIIECNTSNALKLLDDMFYVHIEPFLILAIVSSAYVDMYRMYTAQKSAFQKSDVANDFAYPKNKLFTLDRAAQNLKRFDANKLRISLKCLTDTDKSLKSYGADSRTILEEMTVKLIYIISKGEPLD